MRSEPINLLQINCNQLKHFYIFIYFWQSFGGEIENAVKLAIDSGYRLIDTAWAYENEAEIGKAIRTKIAQGVVKRTDLFIVNKVRQTIH